MQNKFFDFKTESQTKEVSKIEDDTNMLYSAHLQFSYSSIEKVEKDLILPAIGGIVWLDTNKPFNVFDIIHFIGQKTPIKNLYCSTYSIARNTIDSIVYMHDKGMIEQMTLLISESMIKRNPNTIDNLLGMKTSRANLNVLFSWTHAKIYLMETHNAFYVLEGSGNMASNAHFEQYILANSKEVFEYRKSRFFENDKLVKY